MSNYHIDEHKLLWHVEKLAEWKRDNCISPIYLEISPVSFCNHNCVYCGVDFARKSRNKLDTTVIKKSIKELSSIGIRSVMYAGEGEPLLHPDIPDIIAYTKGCGIDVALTTNGVSATDVILSNILPMLSWIRFSVDSVKSKTYSEIHRSSKKDFEKVISNIKNAVHIKNKLKLRTTIGVQFLILNENKSEIEKAVDYFSNLKIDYLSFKPFSKHPQMINSKEETYDLELIEKLKKLDNYSSESDTKIICRVKSFLYSMKPKLMIERCLSLPFWGYISSDGNFYTCSVHLGDEKFITGNIYSNSMQEIIFGDKRRNSIKYGKTELDVKHNCRINCRMARVNEFLEELEVKPEHVNFI